MNGLVLTFDPAGQGHCLYSEAIDLARLGRLEIARASTIEFNNQTQHWEVKNLRNQVLFFARSRNACLEWEQQNLP